jgi:small-conductance mechanosensitive channel
MNAKLFIFLFLCLQTLNAAVDMNVSVDDNRSEEQILAIQAQQESAKNDKIQEYKTQLETLKTQISDENMWIKSYASYLTALDVKNNLESIKARINYLSKHAKTASEKSELSALKDKQKILATQVETLKGDFALAPFSELITPPNIEKIPEITNPFDIFTGLSLIKTFDSNFEEYKKKKEALVNLINILQTQARIYKKLQALDTKHDYAKSIAQQNMQIEMFKRALDTMDVTMNVYQKRLDVAEVNINKSIKRQVYGLMKIATIIFVIFLIFFLLKLMVKKYITDNERFYMANKIITFTNFTIIILVLFFNYIENASYIVTILGFASAGIAIAMKDWFMSLLGWLVIVFGGSIHVGDRIRVDLDGMKYVGDVLDISLLRITILEDITLTSIMQNRRAGRIIFIPNNYIFTKMIANYTHNSLKTVWDGVKITITFDSNHKKAMHIVKEITKKYSKGYTDITRKQLNKLRQNYSLKNTNVEPRIYSFIESNGLDIEAWYLTNAYGTLTLRSVISSDIVDAFNNEDDITIAYPTQKLNVSMHNEDAIQHNHELV